MYPPRPYVCMHARTQIHTYVHMYVRTSAIPAIHLFYIHMYIKVLKYIILYIHKSKSAHTCTYVI